MALWCSLGGAVSYERVTPGIRPLGGLHRVRCLGYTGFDALELRDWSQLIVRNSLEIGANLSFETALQLIEARHFTFNEGVILHRAVRNVSFANNELIRSN